MSNFKTHLGMMAILTSGLMVGCKGKNTAPFAPVCSPAFVETYAQLNEDSAEFNRLYSESDRGRRDGRRDLKQAANNLLESCILIQESTHAQSCALSSGADATQVSASDFNDECAKAAEIADDGRGGDWRTNDLPGDSNWQRPGDDNRYDNAEMSQIDARSMSMKIVDASAVKQALNSKTAVALVDGQPVSLRSARESITKHGKTACTLQTQTQKLTAGKTLGFSKVSSRVESQSNSSIEKVQMMNDEGLAIVCQKLADQPTTFQDVADALNGIIQLNLK